MNEFNREDRLRNEFNSYVHDVLSLPEKNYYDDLSTINFYKFKQLLSTINNIITFKMTIAFIMKISDVFKLSDTRTNSIIKEIQDKNVNSNGYDVEINVPVKIIAEVKGNIPINKGNRFGSAQKTQIFKDLNALRNGKSTAKINPKDYFKFFILPNILEVHQATENLCKKMDDIVFMDASIIPSQYNKIYVVYVDIT